MIRPQRIMGVDCAMATCGWAIVERSPKLRLVELGVITTDPSPIERSTDRSRRIATVSREIEKLQLRHNAIMIAAEQPLGFGSVHAILPQALCFGALVMLAVSHDIDLAEVRAKEWQPAVIGKAEAEKVNYKHVARELGVFIGEPLTTIKPELRTHAIDAVGIALFAALRPVTLVHRGKERRTFHEQQETVL